LIDRKPVKADGLSPRTLLAAERRLKLKFPIALTEYYLLAGKLALNREHNRLFAPSALVVRNQKLIFMEENQVVVFWGMDIDDLSRPDPNVFQATREEPLDWHSEGLPFSDFILKMWRWQRGPDPSL
jgi:hypothetical protein